MNREKEKLIDAALKFLEGKPDLMGRYMVVDAVILADFALSVSGWTAINGEDDLPKEYRTYVWTNRFTDDVTAFSYHPEANVPEAFVKSYAAWMPLPAPYEPQEAKV